MNAELLALMRTLSHRNLPIPTLYVKSAPATYYIRSVFNFARQMSPCLLVLEDIETIVNPSTRSYFFNEVDGLENNDGILMVASTNYLDRLDPGLTKRPSRFDRKYLFPLPNEEERRLYAEYWREKLKSNSNVEYPKILCAPIAKITNDFSFAYMQEAFVSSLLELARRRTSNLVDIVEELALDDGGEDDLDQYVLWRVFKKQVKILREDMDTGDAEPDSVPPSFQVSQVLGPLEASTPALPGTYREESPTTLSAARQRFSSEKDLDKDLRAQTFLSQFSKFQFINPAATEYRPAAQGLTWAKRS